MQRSGAGSACFTHATALASSPSPADSVRVRGRTGEALPRQSVSSVLEVFYSSSCGPKSPQWKHKRRRQ